MSDISDNEYLSSEGEEEEEEEITPIVHKKGIKPIIPHSFGSTVTNQHIIGDAVEEDDGSDADDEDQIEKTQTSKSAKGKKKRGKKNEEELDSDYEQDQYASDSDDDSDADNAEDEGLDDGEYDGEDGEDEENEEEEPEKYMHHFDKEINKEYILETHPECIPVNMAEVRAMLNVVRNKDGVIIDDFHKTIPFVTKYEKARIIGQRAAQLDAGATPYVNAEFLIDGASIAELEFEEKKIPVIIKRPLPNGAFEYWRLKDLEILY